MSNKVKVKKSKAKYRKPRSIPRVLEIEKSISVNKAPTDVVVLDADDLPTFTNTQHNQYYDGLLEHIAIGWYRHARTDLGSAAALGAVWLRSRWPTLCKGYSMRDLMKRGDIIEVYPQWKFRGFAKGYQLRDVHLKRSIIEKIIDKAKHGIKTGPLYVKIIKFAEARIKLTPEDKACVAHLLNNNPKIQMIESDYFRYNEKGRQYAKGISLQNAPKRIRNMMLLYLATERKCKITEFDLSSAQLVIANEILGSKYNDVIDTLTKKNKKRTREEIDHYMTIENYTDETGAIVDGKKFVYMLLFGSHSAYHVAERILHSAKHDKKMYTLIWRLLDMRTDLVNMVAPGDNTSTPCQKTRSDIAIMLQTKEYDDFTAPLQNVYGDKIWLSLHDAIFIEGDITIDEIQSHIPSYLIVEKEWSYKSL